MPNKIGAGVADILVPAALAASQVTAEAATGSLLADVSDKQTRISNQRFLNLLEGAYPKPKKEEKVDRESEEESVGQRSNMSNATFNDLGADVATKVAYSQATLKKLAIKETDKRLYDTPPETMKGLGAIGAITAPASIAASFIPGVGVPLSLGLDAAEVVAARISDEGGKKMRMQYFFERGLDEAGKSKQSFIARLSEKLKQLGLAKKAELEEDQGFGLAPLLVSTGVREGVKGALGVVKHVGTKAVKAASEAIEKKKFKKEFGKAFAKMMEANPDFLDHPVELVQEGARVFARFAPRLAVDHVTLGTVVRQYLATSVNEQGRHIGQVVPGQVKDWTDAEKNLSQIEKNKN